MRGHNLFLCRDDSDEGSQHVLETVQMRGHMFLCGDASGEWSQHIFLCRITKNYPQLSPNTPSCLEL